MTSGGPLELFEPLSKLAGPAWGFYQGRKRDQLRAEIQRQLLKGRFWAFTDDAEVSAVIYTIRALEEGLARHNLNLIVQTMFASNPERSLAADDFRRHATMLASLSIAEVQIVAAWIRTEQEIAGSSDPNNDRINRFNELVAGEGRLFPTWKDAHSAMIALMRTGLVGPITTGAQIIFEPTPLLHEIAVYVDFDEAIAQPR